jgi:hypothetical protein
MKSLALPALILCGLSLMGCTHTQPLVSHAHVGHVLTHWGDTPDHAGLLPVARQELEAARHEAEAALTDAIPPAEKATHIRNISRALDPDAEKLGPGLGYGAIRALEAAVEHLEYAATSDDASANIVSSVADLSGSGDSLLEQMRSVAARAKSADMRDANTLDRTALDLRASLGAIATGMDQLQTQLDAMLRRETNPKYQPLPEKYLLGLVRLPNGKWTFASLREALSRPSYGY